MSQLVRNPLRALFWLLATFLPRGGGERCLADPSEVVSVWRGLDWKNVAIVTMDEGGAARRLSRSASDAGIATRAIQKQHLISEDECVFLILDGDVVDDDDDGAPRLVHSFLTSGAWRPYRLMVLSCRQARSDRLREHFRTADEAFGFYLLMKVEEIAAPGMSLLRLQSLRRQEMLVENVLDEKGGRYSGGYDMSGARLTTATPRFPPWLDLEDCDDGDDSDCAAGATGALADIFSVLGGMFNFSLSIRRLPDQDWGTPLPSEGVANNLSLIDGAIGAVANYECDLGLSFWSRKRNRDEYVDFTDGLATLTSAVAVNRNSPPVDFALFVRPFTASSWAAVAAVTVLLAAALLLPPWKPRGLLLSYRTALVSAWAFFLLTNAFYGGALTMFFSSAPTVPFSTAREGLALYPDWKMVVPRDDLVLVESLASEVGDAPFVAFFERSTKPGAVEIQASHREALMTLLRPGHFVYSTMGALLEPYHELDLRSRGIHLQLVGKKVGYYGSVILNKGSPFKAMLNKGIQKLRQTGTLDLILSKWSPNEPQSAPLETSKLEGGEVRLVFLAYAAVGGIACAVVFLAELAASGLTKRFGSWPRIFRKIFLRRSEEDRAWLTTRRQSSYYYQGSLAVKTKVM